MTGITISTKQVEIANRLTKAEAEKELEKFEATPDHDGFVKLGRGKVRFIELDAEKMGDFFAGQSSSFDAVWISEALSHFPNKTLFFENAFKVLKPGGKLALADWFKGENINETDFTNDVKPIEGNWSSKHGLRAGSDPHLPYATRWHAPPATMHSTGLCRPGSGCRASADRKAKGYQQRREQNLVSHCTRASTHRG